MLDKMNKKKIQLKITVSCIFYKIIFKLTALSAWIVMSFFACTLNKCVVHTEIITSALYCRLRPHYIQHSNLAIEKSKIVHAVSAQSSTTCGLWKCDDITVRHGEMFYNDRGMSNMCDWVTFCFVSSFIGHSLQVQWLSYFSQIRVSTHLSVQ